MSSGLEHCLPLQAVGLQAVLATDPLLRANELAHLELHHLERQKATEALVGGPRLELDREALVLVAQLQHWQQHAGGVRLQPGGVDFGRHHQLREEAGSSRLRLLAASGQLGRQRLPFLRLSHFQVFDLPESLVVQSLIGRDPLLRVIRQQLIDKVPRH